MKTIKINGKDYPIKKIGFNEICTLEELGLNVADIQKNIFSTFRAMVALTCDISGEEAGDLIQEHVKNGGTMEDLTPLVQSLVDSDFIQSLQKTK